MTPSFFEYFSVAIFALALVHTFSARFFEQLARRMPRHAGMFHLLGEVEVVFGFWAFVLILGLALTGGGGAAIAYAESRDYTEPLFVFVVMVIAGSRPILFAVSASVGWIAQRLPVPVLTSTAWLGLAAVPLLGSLITEPAAMTVAALLLAPRLFRPGMAEWVKYLALGVLFVNVSIGGTLTAYAAPPVLMVASAWQWDSAAMFSMFGWKAAIAVLVNATLCVFAIRRELAAEESDAAPPPMATIPASVVGVHAALLAAVVVMAHHPVIFFGVFLLFLGYATAYERHQSPLILKEALLVAFFLAGLVVLGGMQSWWLQPLVSALGPAQLFWGALGLTAITDNAALTYLGSLIPDMPHASRYMLVAGAVAGGGLTVIANAPNPAGVALLRSGFADGSIGVLGLLLGALVPTAVAVMAFLLL